MSWLQLILGVIGLARELTGWLHDRRMIAAGAAREIARAHTAASQRILRAAQVAEEAEAAHARDKTDAAFDPSFKRKD